MSDNETQASRDFDKPSKEIALEQIFEATGYKAPVNRITLGYATVVDQFPENLADENSFAPADFDPNYGTWFVGDNGFIYRRLFLSEIVTSGDIPSVPITYPFTTYEGLNLLNSLLGTQMDETDLENDTYPNAQTPVVLRAKPGSLAWIGQRTVVPVNPSHRFLVANPFLMGFVEWVQNGPIPDPLEPYNGLSKDRLVALINEHNNSSLVEGVDFTFGKIVTIYTPEYNTRVRIKPTDTGQYVEQDVFYNRLDISALTRLPPGTIKHVQITQLPFTIHGILPAINEALGLNLTTAEVFDSIHTVEQETYTLQVRSNQLAWMPSSYEFTADFSQVYVGRTMEDGSPRVMEDGSPRDMETAPA